MTYFGKSWNENLGDITEAELKEQGSFLRWFKGDWWKSKGNLKDLCVRNLLASQPSKLNCQNSTQWTEAFNGAGHGTTLYDVGNAAFGSDWKDARKQLAYP